jgi:hypothetical protein
VHALDVLERFTTFGGIDHGTFVRFEGVMHLDDGFVGYFHGKSFELGGFCPQSYADEQI